MAGARAGSAEDAVLGAVPETVVAPATLDEAVEEVAACARTGKHLLFVGGGTELGIGKAPTRVEVVLRTGALDRIIEHAPLDQIVIVECGVRLGALQAVLGQHGQMLALDPPWADRATVGGVVATNAFGARRTRYGSVRDLIIGLSLVRADGTPARGGGKVVKNVAGFDIPKLFTGSLGTLGLIATATFRLHPLPETAGSVLFPSLAVPDVERLRTAIREAQLEPAALVALRGAAAFELGVRFEGFDAGVRQQLDRLLARALSLGLRAELLGDAEASAFWARHEEARSAPAAFRAKLAALRTDLTGHEAFSVLEHALTGPRAVLYPTLGLAFVAGEVPEPMALATAVETARAGLTRRGGALVVHAAPPELRAALDVWGSIGSGLSLMQRMKDRLDPERRLAAGRFVGGI